MPEMQFVVRWPEYFAIGESYTVADFVERSRTALTIASDRVFEKHGFVCSNSLRQLKSIETRAAPFRDVADARVIVEAFEPP